ncbi:dTDP-4-dehydrorhamnose 3,5-epimerase [Orrella sp. JC864]|uniref:dTDP-4-dehydrorhamnose 3,5-epimerase n=1 Tax=Orrella sp. JC864 TaxID=3120298 RepID=UPI00300A77C1
MKVLDTAIADVKIIEPAVFGDERGFFMESFNQAAFEQAIGRPVSFVQDNHSRSRRGVLRGLHLQLPPHPQGKLVRVTSGEVFDVAVDVRKGSPSYGKWVAVVLSEHNKRQFWIPEGLAHGFLVISDTADFLYKTTDYWFRDLERSIAWNDPELGIDWPDLPPILSDKDRAAPMLAQFVAEYDGQPARP